ncbi:hypothetical protein NUU61_000657 [Penicillium alfredii]|uniref:S1 motif domain-containing protein n=1 Tax=Penicillium alfredii TaxID=1506179 RepID=A0A9W9KR98_9EURO|nr:uncharacterized protein NUU61_000657 [Penicillium alfredii]KAJ5114898.1 hypothetical protein NUU61_000657 [Penicillium alfredii]
MDDLSDLELLGLVNKVVSECQNHLGINDKALAEFIIAQRLDSDTFESFKLKITGMDGEFPLSLIESTDRLVRMMHPAMKAKTAGQPDQSSNQRSVEGKAQVFSDLVLPDKAPTEDPANDVLAVLETLEQKNRQNNRQAREKRRSRSRSPETRNEERYRNGVSNRGTDRNRRHGEKEYGRRRRSAINTIDVLEMGTMMSRTMVNTDPAGHGIYDVHVTGVKDFGAFVCLHDVKGSVDGLVHVSRLTDGRVNHPSDLVRRNKPVKVKIMSIDGTRIVLSMKDVDHETGQDFAPQASFGSGANMHSLGGCRNGHGDGGFQKPELAKRQKMRMTSPERGNGEMNLEEDFDIEIREEEPPFLTDQTKQSLELSPIRVAKAPDGSLNRAAISGTALGKERKELRQQEAEPKSDCYICYP